MFLLATPVTHYSREMKNGVYPANLKMAVDAWGTDNTALKAGALARLPAQWPMIRAALAATRREA